MTPELFDNLLREWTKRKPFEAFEVELVGGKKIAILDPAVGFGGGAAGYMTEEEGIVDFDWHELVRIRSLVSEKVSP